MDNKTRYLVISGGIVSGIGKGITAASIGRLLLDRSYKVLPVKADPYLNVDAGTMNPFQHGEVFVTDDGAETDLDLGHYERFLDINLTKLANFTSGAVYRSVMDEERDGKFLGKTIQVIPHITDEIQRRVVAAGQGQNPDFVTFEIGGTVGDIEALPYLEAARQFWMNNPDKVRFIHVVKMDYLYPSDEAKTKPIQHSVSELRSHGIQPNILIVRCKRALTKSEKEKISLFTAVPENQIITAVDANSLYEIPKMMERNGIVEAVLGSFNLKPKPKKQDAFEKVYTNLEKRQNSIRVGICGKYLDNPDAYISVFEAIKHASIYYKTKVELVPIDAEGDHNMVQNIDALIIPGDFGVRGVEGKIKSVQLARQHGIPFLGLCLGMQIATIEIARHIAKLNDATSTEFDKKTPHPVIDFLPEQKSIRAKGGTMRLGSYPAKIMAGSLVEKLYIKYRPEELKNHILDERHRHRYEVNPEYHQQLLSTGLVFSGMSPDGELVEFIELPTKVHPFFVATQAHPEFKSRPHRPHPLFAGLVKAAIEYQKRTAIGKNQALCNDISEGK